MKRLYRSQKDKIIAGVCGGIGEYVGIDPVIIRIITVILFFWGGSGIIAYIIAMIIIPLNPGSVDEDKNKTTKAVSKGDKKEVVKAGGDSGALLIGIVLVVVGGIFLMRNLPFFNEYYWWFRHQIGHIFWPSVLIALGAFMIIRGTKKK